MSMEADIYPLLTPELADKIDGAIGEGSQFHETYGYYAQGVGPETACLPADWMKRVHRIQNRNTQDRIGYSWTFATCSLPRLWPHGRRIESSASRCCSTVT